MDKNKIFADEGQSWAAFQECREKEQRYLNDQRRKKEKRILGIVTGEKNHYHWKQSNLQKFLLKVPGK